MMVPYKGWRRNIFESTLRRCSVLRYRSPNDTVLFHSSIWRYAYQSTFYIQEGWCLYIFQNMRCTFPIGPSIVPDVLTVFFMREARSSFRPGYNRRQVHLHLSIHDSEEESQLNWFGTVRFESHLHQVNSFV